MQIRQLLETFATSNGKFQKARRVRKHLVEGASCDT